MSTHFRTTLLIYWLDVFWIAICRRLSSHSISILIDFAISVGFTQNTKGSRGCRTDTIVDIMALK